MVELTKDSNVLISEPLPTPKTTMLEVEAKELRFVRGPGTYYADLQEKLLKNLRFVDWLSPFCRMNYQALT